MRYRIRFCTGTNGWNNPYASIEKDWRLKDWQDNGKRLALVAEAQELLKIPDSDVRAWRIDI